MHNGKILIMLCGFSSEIIHSCYHLSALACRMHRPIMSAFLFYLLANLNCHFIGHPCSALYLTEYAVVLVFPLLGYFGCKYYRYWMLLVYLTYCILEAVAGVVACVLQDSVSFTAIRCFFILFNIACARYAVQLCQCVRVFQEGDALFLQTSQLLKEVERGTLC